MLQLASEQFLTLTVILI